MNTNRYTRTFKYKGYEIKKYVFDTVLQKPVYHYDIFIDGRKVLWATDLNEAKFFINERINDEIHREHRRVNL